MGLLFLSSFVLFEKLSRAEDSSTIWGGVLRTLWQTVLVFAVGGAVCFAWIELVDLLLVQLGYEIPDYAHRRRCGGCKSTRPGDYINGQLVGVLIGFGLSHGGFWILMDVVKSKAKS